MKKNISGFSLFEMMVVMTIFSLLGIMVTQIMAYTLRGAKKSENITSVRTNLNFTVDIMERNIRNANLLPLEQECLTTSSNTLTIIDEFERTVTYSCDTADGLISSSSGGVDTRITSSDIFIDSCAFACIPGSFVSPANVSVTLSAYKSNLSETERSSVTIDSQINLRSYDTVPSPTPGE